MSLVSIRARGKATKLMTKLKRSSYRPEIDGIRAFAVTAVIINHFNKAFLPNGYLGVDIFFVISGYVITSSLAAKESKNFLDFVTGFYQRRLQRLVPALVIFVLVTSVLICLFNPVPQTALGIGGKALFGLSNISLYRLSTDYFAQSTELNPFTHTWSLGVEEQFYLLFPFLIWFSGFGRQTVKGVRNLFILVAAITVASLIGFVSLYQTNQPAAYFLMPTRFWEMAAGCLVFIGYQKRAGIERVLEKVPPLLTIVAMVGVMFLPLSAAVPATISVVVLSTILIACLKDGTVAFKLFTAEKIVYIGSISYSLYLWHWGVLSLSRWTIGIYWWSVPFQIALMLLLSILSYRYVETPLRRSHWSAIRWKSIGYGMSSSAIVALLLLALVKIPHFSLFIGHIPKLAAVGVSSLTDPYLLKETNSVWRGEKCVLSDNSQVGKKISLNNCTLGNFSNAKKSILVLGNSFSAAFTQAFDRLVVSDKYSVTIISCIGAYPVKEIPNKGLWDKANNYYWDSVVPSAIDNLSSGDWVFLINDLADFSPKDSTPETNERLKQLESGLEALSGKLSVRGIRLAILHGIPFAREANCQPEMAAKQWFSPFGGPCKLPSRSESLLRRDNLNKVLSSLEAKGKLRIVDLFDIFCPGEQCNYNAKNGQFLYRDEYSHPSVEGARLSSPIIRKVLTST